MYLSIIIDAILSVIPLFGGVYVMLIGFNSKKEHEEITLYGVGLLLSLAGARVLSGGRPETGWAQVCLIILVVMSLTLITTGVIKWARSKRPGAKFYKSAYLPRRRHKPKLVKKPK